jgi:endoglucanase
MLGKNAVARSFVTGYGIRPPKHLHHRIMLGYAYSEPFPGLLVGGPNSEIEDDLRIKPSGILYPKVPPARQYLDHRDSAATNEVCINWNAALVFILSFLEDSQLNLNQEN